MVFSFKNVEIEVDNSWDEFFGINMEEISSIQNQILENYTPSADKIFRIFKIPISKIDFVIVGQDPYPSYATGRSFEYEQDSWADTKPSLVGILIAVYYHFTGEYCEYEKILEKIEMHKWKILPPSKLFKHLESRNGCFFLNKSLSTESGLVNAHYEIWASFTNKLVEYISAKRSVDWFLWGNKAQGLECLIKEGVSIVKTIHPAYFYYVPRSKYKQKQKEFAEKCGIEKILRKTIWNNSC